MHTDRAVQDYANLLTEQQQLALNIKLKNYADSTSTGIVVAIMKDIEDDINFQAAQILTDWGLGQKGKDNGVLLLMAVNQRKIAISTGYGVEDKLTDAMSRRIIQNDIIPYFKQNDYYEGFNQGTTAIMSVLSGTYKNTESAENFNAFPFLFILFFIILFIIISIKSSKNGRNGGGNNRSGNGGMDLTDFIILSSLGRSMSSGGSFGSGGGGFSGGGFGGFGGGMGGGGGASGSW